MFFYDNELARLGLNRKQRLGRIEMYVTDDDES